MFLSSHLVFIVYISQPVCFSTSSDSFSLCQLFCLTCFSGFILVFFLLICSRTLWHSKRQCSSPSLMRSLIHSGFLSYQVVIGLFLVGSQFPLWNQLSMTKPDWVGGLEDWADDPYESKWLLQVHYWYWNHYKHLTGINDCNVYPVFTLMSLVEELLKTGSAFFLPSLIFL